MSAARPTCRAPLTMLLVGVVALKPELFEGLRFEVNRPVTQNIFLAHR
jgi:hypothetical protein